MKLTIHIGMPRAGERAIQQHLYSLGARVGPVASLHGHSELLLLAGTPRATQEFSRRCGPVTQERKDEFKQALANSETDHVILSCPMLYDLADRESNARMFAELDDIFDEIKVVVYFRHQADDFTDLIIQRVLAGMKDWQQINEIPDNLYRYDSICDLWESDVDVIARDYARCKGDVVADFCAAVGIPAPDHSTIAEPPHLMKAKVLQLMVLVNTVAGPSNDSLRRRIARELDAAVADPVPFVVSADLLARIEETYRDGNRYLSECYLGGLPLLKERKLATVSGKVQ